jgi:hypothetical protein
MPIILFPAVIIITMGVFAISYSLGMMLQEQKRHNQVMEQIAAKIRDRCPVLSP